MAYKTVGLSISVIGNFLPRSCLVPRNDLWKCCTPWLWPCPCFPWPWVLELLSLLSLLKANSSNYYALAHRHNLPFLISDIWALWRSGYAYMTLNIRSIAVWALKG